MSKLKLSQVFALFLNRTKKGSTSAGASQLAVVLLIAGVCSYGWSRFYLVGYAQSRQVAESRLREVEGQIATAGKRGALVKGLPSRMAALRQQLDADLGQLFPADHYREALRRVPSLLKAGKPVFEQMTSDPRILPYPGAPEFPFEMAIYGFRLAGTKDDFVSFLRKLETELPYASVLKLGIDPMPFQESGPGEFRITADIGFLLAPAKKL